MQLTVLQLVN